jgi:putative Mg2+ transporter-C (MgtC) family protein
MSGVECGNSNCDGQDGTLPGAGGATHVTTLPINLTWGDVALRLTLATIAGGLVGFNRSEQGKAAGMRTTLLVCLAATISMIQVNILLPTAGRPTDSFVMNDLMRLPLGILTGVGFIGGGVILRRDNIVVGVTTAATLWLMTVVGLCFGGGQIDLGLAGTALGLFTLWLLPWFERRVRREHRARLWLEVDALGPTDIEIRHALNDAGLSVMGARWVLHSDTERREYFFDVHHLRLPTNTVPPAVLSELAKRTGVVALSWDGLR